MEMLRFVAIVVGSPGILLCLAWLIWQYHHKQSFSRSINNIHSNVFSGKAGSFEVNWTKEPPMVLLIIAVGLLLIGIVLYAISKF